MESSVFLILRLQTYRRIVFHSRSNLDYSYKWMSHLYCCTSHLSDSRVHLLCIHQYLLQHKKNGKMWKVWRVNVRVSVVLERTVFDSAWLTFLCVSRLQSQSQLMVIGWLILIVDFDGWWLLPWNGVLKIPWTEISNHISCHFSYRNKWNGFYETFKALNHDILLINTNKTYLHNYYSET